jgi:hypothetical protein
MRPLRVLAAALALGAGERAPAVTVTVEALTYNVAGIIVFSESNPFVNTKLISPLLNDFDLACVQEDFHFHLDLVSESTHPFRSEKDWRWFSGDGLNTLSRSPFSDFVRATWSTCHGWFDGGWDCWGLKGFTFARHELAPGLPVDVYDLHADAGNGPEDEAARAVQREDLDAWIFLESFGRAVIVLGDFNARYTEEAGSVAALRANHGLRDAWIELERGGVTPAVGDPQIDAGCSTDPGGPDCERVDKVLYRSGGGVVLTPLAYDVPSHFVDALGDPLSDHEPVHVTFEVAPVP